MRIAWVFVTIWVFLLSTCLPAPATDVGNLSKFMENFCWKQTTYLPEGNVGFAPVEKVPEGESRPGLGKYRLREEGYPGSVFRLGDAQPLTFVSRFDPPAGQPLPLYLWHLISVPRSGKAWDGVLTNPDRALRANAISQDDYGFLSKRSGRMTFERGAARQYLVYNWAPSDQKYRVTELWQSLFGSTVMQFIVQPNQSYDHQFYFVPVPQRAETIRQGSWLHPSRRKVFEPGQAFGFVLDDQGECIGKDVIQISR